MFLELYSITQSSLSKFKNAILYLSSFRLHATPINLYLKCFFFFIYEIYVVKILSLLSQIWRFP